MHNIKKKLKKIQSIKIKRQKKNILKYSGTHCFSGSF